MKLLAHECSFFLPFFCGRKFLSLKIFLNMDTIDNILVTFFSIFKRLQQFCFNPKVTKIEFPVQLCLIRRVLYGCYYTCFLCYWLDHECWIINLLLFLTCSGCLFPNVQPRIVQYHMSYGLKLLLVLKILEQVTVWYQSSRSHVLTLALPIYLYCPRVGPIFENFCLGMC